MKFNKTIDPFKLEELRASLAEKKNFIDLLKLYKSNIPEIRDENNRHLWDKLNKREELNEQQNYMEKDKLIQVSKKIKKKNARVLNIGFGSANLEEILLKDNSEEFEWIGIDISKESVIIARKKYNRSKFKLGDIRKLRFKNNQFDYIIALEVLEHIQPKYILNALRDIYIKLNTNGKFILSVPLNENLEEMVKNNFNPNAHVRVYTPQLICAELELSGFEVESINYFYAFKSRYRLKSLIVRNLFKSIRKPNGILVVAHKK